jgi:hypothetical protein
LDTLFCLIDGSLFLCLDKIAENDAKFGRMAHAWVRSEHKYVDEITMQFGQWMKRQGYRVIMTFLAQQKDCFTNNMPFGRDSSRKMPFPTVEKVLRNHEFDGRIFSVDFSAVRSMSSGVHSATQILRKPE